ncbi:MAG TPA: ClpXP protease specificity-enhancing factor [Rhodanobacteraceae bacterium]|nr:ClpXP protease specificity-enhancing factor [Rhodanobacteraceae bacterium]
MTSNRPYLLRAVHAWICDNDLTPYIVVDAAAAGVRVPPQVVSDGRVVLNLAPRAVAHLEIGNDAITCMARFGGVSQPLEVPITAVQAIYARENGQGMLLAADAPGSVAEPAAAPPGPVSPSLQAVPSQQDVSPAPGTGDHDNGPDKPRPKGKPSLHVVK